MIVDEGSEVALDRLRSPSRPCGRGALPVVAVDMGARDSIAGRRPERRDIDWRVSDAPPVSGRVRRESSSSAPGFGGLAAAARARRRARRRSRSSTGAIITSSSRSSTRSPPRPSRPATSPTRSAPSCGDQANARVLLAEATAIDVAARQVVLADGRLAVRLPRSSRPAPATPTSATTTGRRGAPGLKTPRRRPRDPAPDPPRLREGRARARSRRRRRALLTFVLVGGGPTGRRARGRDRRDLPARPGLRLPGDRPAGRADRPDRGGPAHPPGLSRGALARRRRRSSRRLGVEVRDGRRP